MQTELKNELVYAKTLVREDGIQLIIVKGSVDYLSTDPLASFMNSILDEIKDLDVVVDISGVNYMSSTAIGLFVNLLKKSRSKNINLYLMGINQKVFSVFQLLGFSSFFKFISSFEEVKPSKKVQPAEKKKVFPKIIACKHCGARFRINKPSRYRCPKCKNIFAVNEKGGVL